MRVQPSGVPHVNVVVMQHTGCYSTGRFSTGHNQTQVCDIIYVLRTDNVPVLYVHSSASTAMPL